MISLTKIQPVNNYLKSQPEAVKCPTFCLFAKPVDGDAFVRVGNNNTINNTPFSQLNRMPAFTGNNNPKSKYLLWFAEPERVRILKELPLTPVDTPEIIKIRKSLISKKVLDTNNSEFLNIKNNLLFDYFTKIKDIPKEGKMFIVIGYPGAGKTTCIKKHAKKFGLDINKYLNLDADDIKQELPGYDNGKGASTVHGASLNVFDDIFNIAKMTKCNIIIQTTGWPEHVELLIKSAKDSGYKKIKMIYIDVKPEVAQQRVVSRFESPSGRFLDPYIINAKDNYPKRCYELLKNNKDVEKIYQIDNNSDIPKFVNKFTPNKNL